MNAKNFEYSLKNIPSPSKAAYIKSLIDKVEHFIKRLRWKAFFFEKEREEESSSDNSSEDEQRNTFGFKTPLTPPKSHLLNAFENDMYDIIKKVDFDPRLNDFQQKLKRDCRDINASQKLLIPADKSTNLYELDKEQYNKLLAENITKSYKKSSSNLKDDINREARAIASSLGVSDRVQCLAEKESFVTLKDHKDNFLNKPTCRLINPAKSELGHVSKRLLERIVSDVRSKTSLNQWGSTSVVIDWFKNIPSKTRTSFIKFDIVDFYPSITEQLLDRAIDYAKSVTDVTESEIQIIKHARRSLLFSKDSEWVKKNGDEQFDVTMGSYDGAEVCELVGLYLLSRLTPIMSKDSVGLYRDDGLAAIGSRSGRQLDQYRKKIVEVFKSEGLSITIVINLTRTDYLDAMFDLDSGKYSPYRKPNSKPLYIHAKSNHPPTIIKELPNMINRRISDLSCDREEFTKAKGQYEDALQSSGFKPELEFNPTRTVPKNRNRKVIWFNPPYSSCVKTNVGKKFLSLVRKHFKRSHPYYKIFNINTLKLSYSCMPSMGSVIKQHNNNLLKPVSNEIPPCNCQNKDSCPLPGGCRTPASVYTATVSADSEEYVYHGTAEGEVKARIKKHETSFRLRRYENDTELSKFIWKLQDNGTAYSIRWSIELRAHPYRCGAKRCDLCLSEKMVIARSRHGNMLNKRSELISKCRHRNKFVLCNLKCS